MTCLLVWNLLGDDTEKWFAKCVCVCISNNTLFRRIDTITDIVEQ
jgi:hypothetical protein